MFGRILSLKPLGLFFGLGLLGIFVVMWTDIHKTSHSRADPQPKAEPRSGLEVNTAASQNPRLTSQESDRSSPETGQENDSGHPLESQSLALAPSPAGHPKDPPRKLWQHDFTTAYPLERGYILDGLKVSGEGLMLANRAPEEGKGIRAGRLESPPETMEFPARALSPMWKAELPADTGLLLEFSVSSNRKDWGEWHGTEINSDSTGNVSPTNPDGRTNPSHGYIPGTMVSMGPKQGRYFRFRLTMYSTGPESPTLKSLRVFYQDSALEKWSQPKAEEL